MSRKPKYKEAKHRRNVNIDSDIREIVDFKKYAENQNKILHISIMLKEIFVGSKAYDDD